MVNISEKIREARLRRLGHVERKTEEYVVMRTWNMEVGTQRKIAKLKKIKTGQSRPHPPTLIQSSFFLETHH